MDRTTSDDTAPDGEAAVVQLIRASYGMPGGAGDAAWIEDLLGADDRRLMASPPRLGERARAAADSLRRGRAGRHAHRLGQ
jgi:hypothetical protein